jgi:cytochrome b6-f complex iron-sulfur subunit
MPTRRRLLDAFLGFAVTGMLGSIFYPAIRYLKPLPATGPTGPTRLTEADLGKLASFGFVIVSVAGHRALVFRDADGSVRAFDARCTHEGCTVQYLPGESAIWCACHNARFDTNGRVLSGPPPRPLPRYTTREDEDGSILVLAETA